MGQGIELNIIYTPRLRLRKLRETDAPLVQRLNSDPRVMRFIGPVEPDIEKAKASTEKHVVQYQDRPGLGVFVAELAGTASAISESKKETIGWICLKNLDDTDEIEVGYRLLPAYWGKGYATEGARALVKHGFERLGLTEIVGVTLPANLASKAVLQKAGLRYINQQTFYGQELSYFRRRISSELL